MFELDLEKAVGIVGAVSGIAFIWYGAWKSRRVDKVSEQSGIASDKRAGEAQAIEGLNKVIAALNGYILMIEAESKADRAEAAAKSLVDAEHIRFVTAERDAFQKELIRMQRKYGENGNSKNGIVV